MFGEQPLRDAKQVCWRGVCDVQNLKVSQYPLDISHYAVMWGKKARFGFVPINSHQIYWFCTMNKSIEKIPSNKQQLLDIFEHWHAPVPQILCSTEEAHILRNDLYDRLPTDSWFDNRVVLLGDSIHPTTPNIGQGACMAIESGEVLAHSLQNEKHLEQALQHYQKLRIPRTSRITKESWRVGKIATIRNPLLMWLRNCFVRFTPNALPLRKLQKVFDYDIYS